MSVSLRSKRFVPPGNLGAILFIVFVISLSTLSCRLVTPESLATPTTTITIPTDSPTPTKTQPPTATIPPPTATITPTASILQPGQAITITAITMLDTNAGWGIGDAGIPVDLILKTADGGQTWIDVTPPDALSDGNQLTEALGYFRNADQAWVVYSSPQGPAAEASVIWRTADGGRTWQASHPLDQSGLENVFDPSYLYFVDDDTGWLLAHVGVGMSHDYVALFKSTDGGITFNRILDPYNDGGIQACYKNAMLFTDAQHGWLTGTCGGVAAGVLLFRTNDGGLTWQDVTLPPPDSSPDLFTRFDAACDSSSPAFLNEQTGYIAVSCDLYDQEPRTTEYYLFSTRDGGDSWRSTSYPGGELRFFNPQTGLALGKEIYKTENGGRSWMKISVLTWEGAFDFPDQSHAWAVARSDDQVALVVSQDGGQYWSIIQPELAP